MAEAEAAAGMSNGAGNMGSAGISGLFGLLSDITNNEYKKQQIKLAYAQELSNFKSEFKYNQDQYSKAGLSYIGSMASNVGDPGRTMYTGSGSAMSTSGSLLFPYKGSTAQNVTNGGF